MAEPEPEPDDLRTFVSSLSTALDEPELTLVLPLALDLFPFLLLVFVPVFGVPSLDFVLDLGEPSLALREVLPAEFLDLALSVSPFDLLDALFAGFLTFAGVFSLDLPPALPRLVLPLDFPVEVPPILSKENLIHQQSAVVSAPENQNVKTWLTLLWQHLISFPNLN